MNLKNYILGGIGAFLTFLLPFVSCSDGKHLKEGQHIVFNELMPSNRTGLLTHKGKPADWVELKNNSTDSISLKGFQLAVIKNRPDSIPEEEWEEEAIAWEFPDIKIGGGECLVVFADKKKPKEEGGKDESEKKDKKDKADKKEKKIKSLIADFNLPKEGGTLQLLTPGGSLIKEFKYGEVKVDQSLALQPDSTYVATYWESPGFENTKEGYEKAVVKMDDQRSDPLKIWEVYNRSSHSYDNWIELKNTGSSEINLSQYSLAKKPGKKDTGWSLPNRTLQPGEIITIQLAGNRASADNPTQASVKIGNSGAIILKKDGKFVDGINAKNTTISGSKGRMSGSKGFFYFPTPTKGTENAGGKRFVADSPQFDKQAGVYSKNQKLALRLKNPSQKVHYTTDGSEPTVSSPLLKDSLVLTKGTVVRTFAEGDSVSLRSPVATSTFLLGVSHEIPVMNISANNADLFDFNTGIYADGPGKSPERPYLGANFWKDWTKKAHVEFFDNIEGRDGFSADCGVKIFGGFSRFEPKKSFRLKFRGNYGDTEVDYDVFNNGKPMEYEDLVIRSGSQDWNRCMVRDEFFTSLMKQQSPNILTQEYRPVALYINAQYFGLYFIREKINNDFVARKLDIPNDSISIIFSKGLVERGSGIPYKDLMNFVSTNDMTNAKNYEYVKNNVDLDGLIDYKLGEIYSGNTDVGNIRYVRSTSDKSDKKWHFIFYDLDATWVGYNPTPAYYITTNAAVQKSNVSAHNTLISRLLANNDFRELFLQRLSHHMKNTFTPDNTTKVFDHLVATIRPEMKRNCERWPQLSYEKWEKNVETFKEKFKDKHTVMLDAIREIINITPAENQKYFAGI